MPRSPVHFLIAALMTTATVLGVLFIIKKFVPSFFTTVKNAAL